MSPETIGWAAAALMVATFSCRDARRMRALAVATNLAFVAYGAAAGLQPVLALHALLLPINLWRWLEASGCGSALVRALRGALAGDALAGALAPPDPQPRGHEQER